MTIILALDLGTTTGWALLGRDGSVTSGSECFKPQRFEGGGALIVFDWESHRAKGGNAR